MILTSTKETIIAYIKYIFDRIEIEIEIINQIITKYELKQVTYICLNYLIKSMKKTKIQLCFTK